MTTKAGNVPKEKLAEKIEVFRKLHVPGTPLILYNIWDVGSALAVIAAGMEIGPIVVALPDFHHRVAKRLAVGAQDFAREVRDGPDRGGELVVDDNQVVIGIEREFVRVKRPFRLSRRAGELRGECTGLPVIREPEGGSAAGGSGEEMAAGEHSAQ